jgi:hypothetical protein
MSGVTLTRYNEGTSHTVIYEVKIEQSYIVENSIFWMKYWKFKVMWFLIKCLWTK